MSSFNLLVFGIFLGLVSAVPDNGFLAGTFNPIFTKSIPSIKQLFKEFLMTGEQEVSLKKVVQVLTEFAPLGFAESWDNVGLLVEPVIKTPIGRILLTNDLTEDVMEEALQKNSNLIISYHPPLFVPIKKITNDTWKGRIISKCLANNIAVFSPHTSWDVVPGGLNDWLASPFECSEIKPLQFKSNSTDDANFILSVESKNESLFHRIQAQYPNVYSSKNPKFRILSQDRCSSNSTKFTVQCTEKCLQDLGSILQRSPEVSSYYITPEHRIVETTTGIGRMCKLSSEITIQEAVDKIKKLTELPYVQLALARKATLEHKISKIAFVAGSGGSLLKNVPCDLKITGEASHHDILDSTHSGSSVLVTNHSNSERGFLKLFKKILEERLKNPSVSIVISESDCDPLKVV